MKNLKSRSRPSDRSRGELERQIGYLVRAVEDISNRSQTEALLEKQREARHDDFRDKMLEETSSLKTQVSILTAKIDSLEGGLKKFILVIGSVVAGAATVLGKMDPSAVSALFEPIKLLFS